MLFLLLLACGPTLPATPSGPVGPAEDAEEAPPTEAPVSRVGRPSAAPTQPRLAFRDHDGDGWGDPADGISVGDQLPEGYTRLSGDCDDADPYRNPDATEHCDGRDENCDGRIDEGAVSEVPWYDDDDGDGHGDPSAPSNTCPPPGATFVGDDCDDTDASVYPDAPDLCDDGLDNDCDGAERVCTLWGELDSSAAPVVLTRDGAGGVGSDLDVLADRDGDGRDELAVGVPNYQDTGVRGALLVLPGLPASGDPLVQADASVLGHSSTEAVGYTFGALGDIDGDGLDDMVSCSGSAGSAWVLTALDGSPDDAAAVVERGDLSFFGRWCGGAGDLDGDGVQELAVTALSNADRVPAVFLYDVSGWEGAYGDGDELGSVAGISRSDAVSNATSAGDVDGDGLGDLLVGLSDRDGAGYTGGVLVLGGFTGELDIEDADARYKAATTTNLTGELVAAGGDLDGDGADDVAIAASTSDRGGAAGGAVYLVSGARRGIVQLDDADAMLTGAAGDRIGESLLVHDLDRDGIADVIAGSDLAQNGDADAAGAVWAFLGPFAGEQTVAEAHSTLRGAAESTRFGTALAAGNLDGRGGDDLVVGGLYAEGGDGTVWIFPLE